MKKIAMMMAAATGFVSAEAHKGFSVGGNLGYGQMDSKNKIDTNTTGVLGYEYSQSGRGVLGGLNLAYFHAVGSLNVGLQLQGNLSTIEGKTEQTVPVAAPAWSLKVKQKWEGNASVRLGANLNGAVPYVRVGGSISEFEATSAFNMSSKPSQTTKKQLLGILGGFGADVGLNDKMVVGADFRVTFYPGFDAKQTGTTLEYKHNIKPTTMVGSVGIKYFF